MFRVPEKWRVKRLSNKETHGNNGVFFIPNPDPRINLPLRVVCSDAEGWEHVSASLPTRAPTWGEMCFLKDLFWDPEDTVMQLHPPRSQWISNHPYCLHMWRPIGQEIPMPPSIMVGVKELGELPR